MNRLVTESYHDETCTPGTLSSLHAMGWLFLYPYMPIVYCTVQSTCLSVSSIRKSWLLVGIGAITCVEVCGCLTVLPGSCVVTSRLWILPGSTLVNVERIGWVEVTRLYSVVAPTDTTALASREWRSINNFGKRDGLSSSTFSSSSCTHWFLYDKTLHVVFSLSFRLTKMWSTLPKSS